MPSVDWSGQVLAGLRTLLGLWIVLFTLPLLDQDAVLHTTLWLDRMMQTNPYPLLVKGYQWLIQPHTTTLLEVLVVGQLLLGGALILGFFTRWTALACALYTVMAGCLVGHAHWAIGQLVLWLVILEMALVFGKLSQQYSVDALLFPASTAPSGGSGGNFKSKHQQSVVNALNQKLKKGGKKKASAASAS